MIYNASKEIQAALEDAGFICSTIETPHSSVVEVGGAGDHTASIIVRFISTDDDNDVAVRIFSFVRVPSEKRIAVLEAINALQRKYRYASFSIDEDNDVTISYDLPTTTNNVGAVAEEMLVRMVQIADEAYPVLMKAIWC